MIALCIEPLAHPIVLTENTTVGTFIHHSSALIAQCQLVVALSVSFYIKSVSLGFRHSLRNDNESLPSFTNLDLG